MGDTREEPAHKNENDIAKTTIHAETYRDGIAQPLKTVDPNFN